MKPLPKGRELAERFAEKTKGLLVERWPSFDWEISFDQEGAEFDQDTKIDRWVFRFLGTPKTEANIGSKQVGYRNTYHIAPGAGPDAYADHPPAMGVFSMWAHGVMEVLGHYIGHVT